MANGNSLMFIILIIIGLFILVQIYNSNKYMATQNEINTKTIQIGQQPPPTKTTSEISVSSVPSSPYGVPVTVPPPPPTRSVSDVVKEYDYRNVRDILVPPVKRPSGTIVPPSIYNPPHSIYTRGYPQNYTWMGILINTSEASSESSINQDNKIVKLFGRQKFPNSTQYQYFVTVNTGNDQTKINLDKDKYRRELYDDDIVTIDELGMTFKVKMNDSNWLEYSPYVL